MKDESGQVEEAMTNLAREIDNWLTTEANGWGTRNIVDAIAELVRRIVDEKMAGQQPRKGEG